ERLTVSVHAEQDTLGAAVPSLVLQPLVENAVRHGRASRTGEGRIEVRAGRHDGMLRLTVENDGDDADGSSTAAERLGVARDADSGLGLAATADRLRLLHGEAGRCDARRLPGGGFRVVLTLPFVRSESDDDPVAADAAPGAGSGHPAGQSLPAAAGDGTAYHPVGTVHAHPAG